MKFVILEKEEFREFLMDHPLNDFAQAPEMEEISALSQWHTEYVGVKNNDILVAGTRLTSKKSHFGKKYFYAPRGLILDYSNEELLSFFVRQLQQYIKKNKGYILSIDPVIIYKERDIDGKIVPHGIDNTRIVNELIKLGFRHNGFTRGMDISNQVRWIFALNLEGQTKESIMNGMRPNTRNLIRKADRMGITIRELSYDELDRFKKITSETGERRNFSDRSLAYYQKMYNLFVPRNEVKFLLASLSLKEYQSKLEEEQKEEKEKLAALIKQASDSKNAKTQRKNSEQTIENLSKKIKKIESLREEDGDSIDLSAAMFMTYGKEVIYLFSGNKEKYMEFNAQYLMQWHMIQYAIEHHFSRYNFYGISGVFDKNDSNYGVYEFKKGFNGYVEEYIGSFELPISFYYNVHSVLKKIRAKKRQK